MEVAARRIACVHARASWRAFAHSALRACSRPDYEKSVRKCHAPYDAAFRGAHAPRVLAKPSRVRGRFPDAHQCAAGNASMEDYFGATPKPTRETRALPNRTR